MPRPVSNVKIGDRVKGGASVLAYLPQQAALAAAGSASAEGLH